jgi:PhoPQ-activated pathogenicity-related protein
MRLWLAFLGAAPFLAAQGAADSVPETALADYVAEPDTTYEWRVQTRNTVSGAEIVRLHLQSQTWRGIAWKHQLFLIRPESLEAEPDQGVLVIAGGRWHERYETDVDPTLPEDAQLFIEIANRLETIVAVLGQVPYQPMFGLSEDDLIAHSFEQFLATGDAEWPLLLPMVKSAVRAMDVAQDFAELEWGTTLEGFTVTGGSKRGWAAWLTGAIDARVKALVPLVIDALNFARHMPYQTTVWGAPSAELAPYTQRGLLEILVNIVCE